MNFKTFYESRKISYSGVVLDEPSRQKILSREEITKYLTSEHDVITHHMTIKLGGLHGTPHEKRLGQIETLAVTHVGVSDDGNIVAVRVVGDTNNNIPHVTVGVNRKKGGKPVMSNYITNWIPLSQPFDIRGKVEELS